ncbi:hypothetical protein D9758_007691 [Tetrapyrgos nigripes]|uniref:Uncharacterized protein n=1 Tax=Tetrapyrgos nigripes TaxID=182062 RepID=A0A8H5LIC9_9AGAR|nr:hypothetical protein D9758_007691 [Tetrapyrgos nigripes]
MPCRTVMDAICYPCTFLVCLALFDTSSVLVLSASKVSCRPTNPNQISYIVGSAIIIRGVCSLAALPAPDPNRDLTVLPYAPLDVASGCAAALTGCLEWKKSDWLFLRATQHYYRLWRYGDLRYPHHPQAVLLSHSCTYSLVAGGTGCPRASYTLDYTMPSSYSTDGGGEASNLTLGCWGSLRDERVYGLKELDFDQN